MVLSAMTIVQLKYRRTLFVIERRKTLSEGHASHLQAELLHIFNFVVTWEVFEACLG
jgi:hypothetical protein